MAKRVGRTQPCDLAQARSRLRQAESFVDAAELVLLFGDDDHDIATPGVAAAIAVLAGIAASDAACCAKLKTRSRGQNHLDAIPLLASVVPHGPTMSKDLERLLHRKDAAHYGLALVTESDATKMVNWAKRLTDNARKVLESS